MSVQREKRRCLKTLLVRLLWVSSLVVRYHIGLVAQCDDDVNCAVRYVYQPTSESLSLHMWYEIITDLKIHTSWGSRGGSFAALAEDWVQFPGSLLTTPVPGDPTPFSFLALWALRAGSACIHLSIHISVKS